MGPRGGPPAHPPGHIYTMANIQSSRAQGPPGGMMGPPGPRMSAAQGNMRGEGRRISSAVTGSGPRPRPSAPFGGFGEDDFAKVGRGPAGGGHGFVEPTRSSQSAWDASGGEMTPQGYGVGGGGQQGYGGGDYGGGGVWGEGPGGRGPRPIPGDPLWLFNRHPYQRSQAFLRF